jgi:U3 small nucleolar RNA-associated protein 11
MRFCVIEVSLKFNQNFDTYKKNKHEREMPSGFKGISKVIRKEKTYKERQQPSGRRGLGPLEKHKDYQIRARKTHQRHAKEKLIRAQAQQRNPDEYYREMTRSHKSESGTVIIDKLKEGDDGIVVTARKQKQFVKTNAVKNLNILRYKHSILRSKISKLKQSLNFMNLVQDKNLEGDEQQNMDDDLDDLMMEQPQKQKTIPKTKHVIFVKNQKQLEEFDPVKHFDTEASLINQPFNRIKKSTLAQTRFNIQEEDKEAIDRATMKEYKALEKYLEKERIVRKAIADLELALNIAVNKDSIEAYERNPDVQNPNFNSKLKDVVAVKFKAERRK